MDPDAKDLEIAHLVVNPASRNRGYGRILADYLYRWSQTLWLWPVFMRVSPDNAAALRCYRQVQFATVAPLAEDMDPQWAWLMRHPADHTG